MKILVLGDGLLGREIVRQTNWDYISRKKDGFDIRDKSQYNFEEYDTIVNCIAFTDTYSDNRELNWDINYKAVADLVDYCSKKEIKLVHISTDYVYTNSKPNSSELDVPIHGDNWYSYTKLLADGYVQLRSKKYLLIRESHKPFPFPYPKAWVDVVGNFDYVNKIVNYLVSLIIKDATGVFNVGTYLKSIYDLAKMSEILVSPILKPDKVPGNLSMDLSKFNNFINNN